MIEGIVQYVESVRKGITLKVDVDDSKRPDNIAAWQDEDIILTNGKNIIYGNLWKIQALSDESTRLLVEIPRGDYPENIFIWKHQKILIKKEIEENGNGAETGSQKDGTTKKRKRRKAK